MVICNVIKFKQKLGIYSENAGLEKCRQTGIRWIFRIHGMVDGHDGNGSYDRGTYWYAKHLKHQNSPGRRKGLCRKFCSRSAGNRVCKMEKEGHITKADILHLVRTCVQMCVTKKGQLWSLHAAMK